MHLQGPGSVIIDRCNFDVQQRSSWLQLAMSFQASPICIMLPDSQNITACSERAYVRGDDGIHGPDVDWMGVCSRMGRDFTEPTLEEGFVAVYKLQSFDDDHMLRIFSTIRRYI